MLREPGSLQSAERLAAARGASAHSLKNKTLRANCRACNGCWLLLATHAALSKIRCRGAAAGSSSSSTRDSHQ
jgi:hypothetical protein